MATQPTRIRAQAAGNKTTVRLLMSHEMESGMRKGPSGDLVPAWHITEVAISLNGKPVFACEFGMAVAKNPYLQFELKGGKAGDKLSVAWKDNKGASRTDEATVV